MVAVDGGLSGVLCRSGVCVLVDEGVETKTGARSLGLIVSAGESALLCLTFSY